MVLQEADDPVFVEMVPRLSALPFHRFLLKGCQLLQAPGVHYTEFVQARTL